jgi:hypothetical protein
MKRKITFMNRGKRADGSAWFMLVFAPYLDTVKGILHKEQQLFVTEDIYNAVEVGQSLVIE